MSNAYAFKIQVATVEDIEVLKSKEFGKQDKLLSEMQYCWTLWKNWEPHPPAIIKNDDDIIVSINAFTIAKKAPNVNCLFLWTHPAYRNEGMGTDLVEYMLDRALEQGKSRLRVRSKIGDLGVIFWDNIIDAFGKTDKERFYDALITEDVIDGSVPTTDKRTIGMYKRLGVTPIMDSWIATLT